MKRKHSSSPCPKKFLVQKSASKILALVLWECQGVILIDLQDKDRILAEIYYSSY